MSYYAVRKGRIAGIYRSWGECEKQVKGFPGAEFKKLKTEEEAQGYLGSDVADSKPQSAGNSNTKSTPTNPTTDEAGVDGGLHLDVYHNGELIRSGIFNSIIENKDGRINAFVDGSYRDRDKSYSYGAFVLNNKGQYKCFSGRGNEPNMAKVRNVAGELIGSIQAIRFAIMVGASEVIVHYDYLGVENWAEGKWACKSEVAKDYKTAIDGLRKQINIRFVKVLAHSQDFGNEVADQLAANA